MLFLNLFRCLYQLRVIPMGYSPVNGRIPNYPTYTLTSLRIIKADVVLDKMMNVLSFIF